MAAPKGGGGMLAPPLKAKQPACAGCGEHERRLAKRYQTVRMADIGNLVRLWANLRRVQDQRRTRVQQVRSADPYQTVLTIDAGNLYPQGRAAEANQTGGDTIIAGRDGERSSGGGRGSEGHGSAPGASGHAGCAPRRDCTKLVPPESSLVDIIQGQLSTGRGQVIHRGGPC